MKPASLVPALPFHDDEVTQGYLARIGHFHAGVDVSRFCRYTGLPPKDVRDGTDACLETIASLAGLDPKPLGHNLLRRLPNDCFLLRGETLAVRFLHRTTVRFCPQCLAEDQSRTPGLGEGAGRLRWSWLLRPVVGCLVHRTVLIECPEPNAVKAFDLSLLQTRKEALLRTMSSAAHDLPGRLQSYCVARLAGQSNAAWLDDQPIAQAVRACEMLGSLLAEGPSANISSYTDLDWARVGDVGFEICAQGTDAITEALTSIRRNSGRRSGRTGPQAVFGQLFIWLEYAPKAEEAGPIRDLLREVILNSFAIGPGETVLGEVVDRRRVHSVNSLTAATGLAPSRVYRSLQKAGMIPVGSDDEALNQWVFPAQEGEHLIERILNAVTLSEIPAVLGCSRNLAERMADAGLITSVVPMAGGGIGVSVGTYNRDDLTDFLVRLCAEVPMIAEIPKGYFDFGLEHSSKFSKIDLIRWQLEGRLRRTRRIGASLSLDSLRFCLNEIRALVRTRSRTDVLRLSAVPIRLRLSRAVVKRLVSPENGSSLLMVASPHECQRLHGKAYVSLAEIERFQAEYLTLGQAAEAIGKHVNSVRRLLDKSISPVRDPADLGVRLYRRQDFEAFLAKSGALVSVPAGRREAAVSGATVANNLIESHETEEAGENDGSNR